LINVWIVYVSITNYYKLDYLKIEMSFLIVGGRISKKKCHPG
jgi:hypothetical protein